MVVKQNEVIDLEPLYEAIEDTFHNVHSMLYFPRKM